MKHRVTVTTDGAATWDECRLEPVGMWIGCLAPELLIELVEAISEVETSLGGSCEIRTDE